MRHGTKHVVVGGLAALLASVALLPISKPFVDRGLEDQARDRLRAAGIEGVTVKSSWARIELTGAPASREAALAAVDRMAVRDAVHSVRWASSAAGGTTPGGTPTAPTAPAPTTPDTGSPTTSVAPTSATVPVAVEANLEVAAGARTITLTGTVPDQAARERLVATAGASGATVKDSLTVTPGTPAAGVADAVSGFGDVLDSLAAGWFTGSASLTETTVRYSGKVPDSVAEKAVSNGVKAVVARKVDVGGDLAVEPGPSDPVTLEARLSELLRLRPVTFVTAQAALTEQGRATLDTAATILGSAPNTPIVVSGYTDDRGRAEINRQLSVARARTVQQYLTTRGVAAQRLTAVGRGENDPVASNATAAGRTANRRIELTVKKG